MKQGRRVYPPEPNEEFEHPLPEDCQPGDYWFQDGRWLCCIPAKPAEHGLVLGDLSKHHVVEHDDKTITVSPSILVTYGKKSGESWHGYLEHGIWREV